MEEKLNNDSVLSSKLHTVFAPRLAAPRYFFSLSESTNKKRKKKYKWKYEVYLKVNKKNQSVRNANQRKKNEQNIDK